MRLCAGLAVAVSALALSGCIAINSVSSSQPSSMGQVHLTVNVCANGSPGCSGPSNSGSIYGFLNEGDTPSDETFPAQYLIGVRLPAGATPVQSFPASYGAGSLIFSRSDSYAAELQALEPAPAGERWWGWISNQSAYSRNVVQAYSATIETALPRPADGGPLPSPLHWRPVVGARVNEGLAAGRPVDCGTTNAQLYDGYGETGPGSDTIICADAPSPEAARGHFEAALTDFGVVGTGASAPAGGSVTLSFLAKRSGAPDPSTTFSLAATSSVPGGGVTLDRSSAPLGGDATQPVLATVTIPKTTPGGAYPVTVTATAAGKPTRSATATLTVVGPPAILRRSLTPKRFRAGAKLAKGRGKRKPVGTTLSVDLSKAATLSVAVERKVRGRRQRGKCSPKARGGKRCTTFKRVGSLQRAVGAGANAIAFAGKLKGRKLAPGAYRFSLVATDGEGRRSKPVKPLAFKVLKP